MFCAEPTKEELGELTNRWFNIVAKLKDGKYPPRQLLKTLQDVGDGTLILEDIFAGQFTVDGVSASGKSSFACIKELPWATIKVGSGMSSLTFDALMQWPQPAATGAYAEVSVFGRRKVSLEELGLALMSDSDLDRAAPMGHDIHACLRGRHFSPAQLKEMLELGHATPEKNTAWSYGHTNFVLCRGLERKEPIFAEVCWVGQEASIYLRSSFPESDLLNCHLITKMP